MFWPGSAQHFSPDVELKFRQSSYQKDLPIRTCKAVIAGLFGHALFLTARYQNNRENQKHWESQGATFTWTINLIILCLIFLICIQSLLCVKGMLPACMMDLEFANAICSAVLMLLFPLQNNWRAARMWGEDPFEVWGEDYFDDTALCLALVGIAVFDIVYLRLRSHCTWILPVCGLLSLGITTFMFGNPVSENKYDFNVRHGMNMALMIMLFFETWQGGWRTEKMARTRFVDFLAASTTAEEERKRVVEESVKAEEERKRAVEERVLRFNAERELDQKKGTWYPTASGANPSQLISTWLVGDPAAHRPDQNAPREERDTSTLFSSTIDAGSLSSKPPLDAPQLLGKVQLPSVHRSDLQNAMKAEPPGKANHCAQADQQPIGRSLPPCPHHHHSKQTQAACFLSFDTPLLCENPQKPGSLVMRHAANVGRMQVLALDKASGKLAYAKVHRVFALSARTQLQWCEVTCCSTKNSMKAKILLANSILAHSESSQALHWRDPVQLNLVTDKLYAIQVPCVTNEDCLDARTESSASRCLSSIDEEFPIGDESLVVSSPSVSLTRESMFSCNANVSEVSLTISSKAQAHAPPVVVAVELELSHALIVGCSEVDTTNPWVAVDPSVYRLPEFKCSI